MNFLRNIDWKKTAIIFGFLAIVAVIGWLIYTLFFVTPTVTPEKKTEQGVEQLPAGQLGKQPGEIVVTTTDDGVQKMPVVRIKAQPTVTPDEIAQGGVTRVTDLNYNQNKSISLAGNDLLTYNSDTGKLLRINSDGTKEELSSRIYKDVQSISWSPTNNQVILEFPDRKNVLYNFVEDKQISLPDDWEAFNFNKAGTQIAYKDMNANPDYRWLGIANADGSGQKYLEPIGNKAADFKVDWSPDGKMVAQYRSGGTTNSSKLYFVGQNNENYKALNLNGYGAQTQWTPDGSRLLYSAHNTTTNNKPELFIVDASGDNIGYNHQSLKLNTWANKCAFANDNTIYCGVPKELPANANMMPGIANNIPDYIYKVDLKTGVKSFVAEPEYDFTIDQIAVSGDEGSLYFTDKLTGNLHTIKLK
jgi:hypothetical protein